MSAIKLRMLCRAGTRSRAVVLFVAGAIMVLASARDAAADCDGGGTTQTILHPGSDAAANSAAGLELFNVLRSSEPPCTISVSPGIYTAPGTLQYDIPYGITVVSTGGATVTTLETSAGFATVNIWPIGGSCPSNATLDGFTLSGPSGGVFVGADAAGSSVPHPGCNVDNQVSNVTLRNLIVTYASTPTGGHGINFHKVQNSVIDSVTVAKAFGNGILIETGSNNNVVMNNTLSANSVVLLQALAIQSSDDNVIVGNTITGSWFDGIFLNSLSGDTGPGSSRNRIERNFISGFSTDGILVNDASHSNYLGHNVTLSASYTPGSSTPPSNPSGTGIWVNNNSNGSYLYGNDVSGSPENGINVLTSKSTLLQGNVVHGNYQGGIWVANVHFAANAASPAPQDTVAHGNVVSFNTLNAQLFFQGAINSQAAFNYFAGTQTRGGTPASTGTVAVRLWDGTGTSVYENTVSEVGARAFVEASTLNATFFRNRFLKGTNIPQPAQQDGKNGVTYSLVPAQVQWDGGGLLGGNHWSEFTAAAANPDPAHPYTAFIGNTNNAPYVDRFPYQSETLATSYAPNTVTVLEPVADSVLAAQTKKTIHWIARGCSFVSLSYYGFGVGLTTIVNEYPNSGFYRWNVPAAIFGTEYHVQVGCLDSNGASLGVSGDSPRFTLADDDLALMNPGRGTRATNGSTIRVAWKKTTLVTSVNVFIKAAGGPETQVATNAPGTYADVLIPGSIADSSHVTIRIQDSGNIARQDSVDGYFMVRGSAPGFSTAISGLRIGAIRTLEWHGPSTSFMVDLDLYANGALSRSIAKNLPDYGHYQWLVSDVQSSDAMIRATFKNQSGATVGTIDSGSFFVSVTGLAPAVDLTGGQDFDGDGRSELAVFRPSSGTWFVRNSGTNYTTNSARQWGFPTDIPMAGDYDGDAQVDFAVYRPSTGTWHILQSINGYVTSVTYAQGAGSDLPVAGDFDGDGRMDPATYRRATGDWTILTSTSNHTATMTRQWGAPGDVPVPNDYDGDGLTDITVFRPANGTWYVLLSTSGQTASREFQWGLPGDIPVPGDYDGDTQAEPAVYRPTTGMWYFRQSSTDFATFASSQWGLYGDIPVPGDYDGDNKSDLAVYRPSEGTWYISQSTTNYTTYVVYQWGLSGDTPAPNAAIAHALAVRSTLATLVRASDFDADRKSDLTVYRPSSGMWFTRHSSTNYGSSAGYQFGLSGDLPLPHDYDGDGQTDIAVFRPSTRFWYVLRSSSGFTLSTDRQWGSSGDVAVPGDYDGDAITDFAVFRPSTRFWHILYSSTNYTTSAALEWGESGDMPIPGDYDGDSISDLAVFRPSNGMWFIRYSSTGYATSSAIQWGLTGDIAVPGEYDGDGRTDIAVYRPSSGTWYVLQSTTNYAGFTQQQWGLSGDTPIAGDFDGDRRTDFAVWRPSTGIWYIMKSSTGFTAFDSVQWGLGGDIPILRQPQ